MVRDVNLWVLLLVVAIQTRSSLEFMGPNYFHVLSAPGSSTELPCDLAARPMDIALLLWFKDEEFIPFYTVDFRNGPPIHWAVAGNFGSRTHFVLNEADPSLAHLAVEKVARQDEGVYRCRIDYVDSPTRNYRVNLTVIVNPEFPRIYDSEGREILGPLAGPFREGQDLLLSCQASGGKPPPDVSWYVDEKRLAITKDGSVCQVHFTNLSRELAGSKLYCKVEPPLMSPLSRELTLKLFLKPKLVELTGDRYSKLGENSTFDCLTEGSRPAPNVDWFIDSEMIDSAFSEMYAYRDIKRSILTWPPRREHNGRQLVCRVSNPWFPAFTLEGSKTINITYAPVAQITVVKPLKAYNYTILREDQTAEMVCSADASPAATNITFNKEEHEDLQEVRDDPIRGISIEGNRLILKNLRKHHAGRYRCRASNSVGTGLSTPTTVRILSRPECAAGNIVQKITGFPGSLIRARCTVTAPPADLGGPLKFFWTLNATAGNVYHIPASNITVKDTTSTVVHGISDTDGEMGWLACWAMNDIGHQRIPCAFAIVLPDLPEPPNHCEVENELLRCEPGHDGGLRQRFVLEALEVRPPLDVMDEDNGLATLNDQAIAGRSITEAVYRASNNVTPQFPLNSLTPGRYTLLVYAETSRGRSPQPTALHSVQIRAADLEKPGSLQTMTPEPPLPQPPADNSVALLIGAALSLVLLTILTTLCVALVVMCKRKSRPRREEQSTTSRRNVGVSMYGSSALSPNMVPTVVLRGHRGSRVLAARWSGVLEDIPMAVLALDTRPHVDTDSSHSDVDVELTRHDDMETQTDS